jgi:phytoene dehydrogenase-like protein
VGDGKNSFILDHQLDLTEIDLSRKEHKVMKNNLDSHYDVTIVGGGFGGMSSALLAAASGAKTLLLEQHYHLGGCASYFQRQGGIAFDAGATTISGVSAGKPIYQWIQYLKQQPRGHEVGSFLEQAFNQQLIAADPGVMIHPLDGPALLWHRDPVLLAQAFSQCFPGATVVSDPNFWSYIARSSKLLFNFLSHHPEMPSLAYSFSHLIKLLSSTVELNSLWPLLFKTTPALFGADWERFEGLRFLINEQMMISTQTHAAEVPALFGLLALEYPSDVYQHREGMKGLVKLYERALEISGVTVAMNARVLEVVKSPPNHAPGDNVAVRFFQGREESAVTSAAVIHNGFQWSKSPAKQELSSGAITVYGKLKSKQKIPSQYHQIHLTAAQASSLQATSKSFYLSLSPASPASLASEQSHFTVSYHCLAGLGLDTEAKKIITELIAQEISRKLGPWVQEVVCGEVGSPKTFERYTGRPKGQVGGHPLTWKSLLSRFKFGRNPVPRVYEVGDGVFPGQSLMGVTQGAMRLHRLYSNSWK